jgi:hypothetical protein
MIRRIFIAVALALLAVPFSASAQTDTRGASFELFGALVRPVDSDSDLETEAFGLRGGFRFNNVFALEGSLSRLNEDVDVWFGDLSFNAFFIHSDRFEVYGLAGPGYYRVSDDGEGLNDLTVHAGLGAEISLGERTYLRPEVRGRWLAEELRFDEGLVDYSLSFGWRF